MNFGSKLALFCSAFSSFALASVSCKTRSYHGSSDVSATHIPVSSAKRQALGNCWIYATTSWLESVILLNTSPRKEYNFSESYFLYRIYEVRLKDAAHNNRPFPDEIYAGGEWSESVDLMNHFGLMREGDFIPHEANDAESKTQLYATEYINNSIRSGLLSHDRSYEAIEHELDQAFGVQRSNLGGKVISADHIQTAPGRTLREELKHWKEIYLPYEQPIGGLPQSAKMKQETRIKLVEIKDHLNQQRPLLAHWWIDFNAVDKQGILSVAQMRAKGGPGEGGSHMTNLVDYVASGSVPNTNITFETDEGAVSKELQELALRYGEIDYLVMRNSWGTHRLDRPDYESKDPQQKHTRGFQRLNADYLFSYLPVTQFNSQRNGGIPYVTGLISIVLPDYGLSNTAAEVIRSIH